MPPLRGSLNGLLNEYSGLIPVDRGLKPNLLQAQPFVLQPVMSFRPSPLADQLLSVDVLALSTTIGAGETLIQWSSAPVPAEEVHRYMVLGVAHDFGAEREFRMVIRGAVGSGAANFWSAVVVRHNLPSGSRTDILGDQPGTSTGAINMKPRGVDLYPGMSFDINNSEVLAATNVVSLQGYRLRMRGPVALGGVDVSGDITATAS